MTARATTFLLALLLLALPAAAGAVVPGANGRIVFDSDHDGSSDIYSVNPDGTGVERLTTSKAFEDEPSWSPDGRRLAYIRTGALWVMKADGSDQHRISHFKPTLRDPAWSPNGRRILFATDDGDKGDLWTIKPDGAGVKRLTNTRGPNEFLPSWSPNGKRIAYTRERAEVYRIVVAKADGSGRKVILPKFGDTQIGPSWSPDGKTIVFSDDSGFVFFVGADGAGRRKGGFGDSPTFSPDGASLALADIDEEAESGPILVRALADGKDVKVSPFPRRDYCDNPDWQRLKPGA